MSLNPYFLQGSPSEQNLIQDLINEHLKIYGIEVYYIPRKFIRTDNILKEVQSSKFDDSFLIESYLNNYEGSNPGSDIMTKFGITLRKEISLTISRERFEEFISPFLEADISGEKQYSDGGSYLFSTRPKEGDLIYFPLGERLFEIKYVEFEKPFYQLGKNYTYELQCELFEYEDEEIDTDIEEIENAMSDTGYITDLKLVAFGGTAECEAIFIPYESGVNEIFINNDGYGYTEQPTVLISEPPIKPEEYGKSSYREDQATAVAITTSIGDAKSISQILITNAGYGYTEPPTITISGGGGFGAIATCGISTGIITRIQITNKGDRYYQPPKITIDPPVGIGKTATAISKIYNGRLSEVLITNAGSGYTSAPNITVSPPPSVGFGTYIISEEVVGSVSGTKAIVKSWTNPGEDIDKVLRVSINNGKFNEGETIVGSSSSAIYTLKSYELDTTNDDYSKNDFIEEESDEILDFSESNPFGTY
jgi:hypothetical protein